MSTRTRVKVIRPILIAMGIYLLIIGLGHIFFPDATHEAVGGGEIFDPNHPWMKIASREMGVLFFVIGVAACIAAIEPLKRKWLVFIVVLASILSDVIRGIGVFSGEACPGLWWVIIISIVLWLPIVIFYPYKEAKEEKKDKVDTV